MASAKKRTRSGNFRTSEEEPGLSSHPLVSHLAVQWADWTMSLGCIRGLLGSTGDAISQRLLMGFAEGNLEATDVGKVARAAVSGGHQGIAVEKLEDCYAMLCNSLRDKKLPVPLAGFIADANDWGRTGSNSSCDDYSALIVVGAGNKMKKLGITLSYSIDGPDSDYGGDSDCSDDGNAQDDKAKESFHITVVEVAEDAVKNFWSSTACETSETSGSGCGNSLSHMFSDAFEQEFVSLEVASPSDGDVEVHKFDRAKAARVMKESGCDEGFDVVLAHSLRHMAAKNHWLKSLRKIFARKRGVPKHAQPLFAAFQSLPKLVRGSTGVGLGGD